MEPYFPSKEELFAAVLDHATVAYRQQLSSVLPAFGGSLRDADGVQPQLHRQDHQGGRRIRLHRLDRGRIGPSFPEVGTIFYRRAPLPTQQMLADFFAGEMAAGHMRSDEPPRLRACSPACASAGSTSALVWGIGKATPDEVEREGATPPISSRVP